MRQFNASKIVYLMVLIFMFLMTSCQATPQEAAVKSKTGDIEELAKQTPPPSASAEVQETAKEELWSESLVSDDGRVTINIDAQIKRPSTQSIPMYKVKRNPFTMRDFDRLAGYFDATDDMLVVNTLGMPTKEAAERVMLKAKGLLSSSNEALTDGEKRYLENAIDNAVLGREGAASRADLKPFVRENYSDDNKEIQTAFFPEGSSDFPSMMTLFTDDDMTIMWYWKTSIETPLGERPNENSTGFLESGIRARDMEMSYEDAEETAKQFVKAVAGDNYDMSFACIGYEDSIYFSATVNSPQCYVFHFRQNYDGVVTTFASPPSFISTSEGVANLHRKPLPNEELMVFVDDSGITRVEWSERTSITEKVTDHVNLLPVEEIKDIFLKQVLYQNAWVGDSSDERAMTIESVELGMMITAEKDNPNQYYALPVWDFIGYTEMKWQGLESPYDPMGIGPLRESIMTINAIDGSIIDRYVGY